MSTPSNVWNNIYDGVKVQIPGITDAVFRQALFTVWSDFTDRTNIWIEEIPMPVDPAHLTYTVQPTKKGTPNRLMLVWDPKRFPQRHWVQGSIEMNKPGVIQLFYAPSEATTWNAVIAKCPLEVDGAGYPRIDPSDEWIVGKYADGLHYGVLGRVMAYPAKPFTNLKLAGVNWQYYIAERSRARGDVAKSNVYGGQRWMYPQSFATTHRKGWT